MRWLLYIVLAVLGLNLFIIAMVGIVLFNDWLRNRKRPSARTFPRGVSDGGRTPTSPPS